MNVILGAMLIVFIVYIALLMIVTVVMIIDDTRIGQAIKDYIEARRKSEGES